MLYLKKKKSGFNLISKGLIYVFYIAQNTSAYSDYDTSAPLKNMVKDIVELNTFVLIILSKRNLLKDLKKKMHFLRIKFSLISYAL